MFSHFIDNPHLIAANLSYISLVWFLFLTLFDSYKYKPVHFLLFVAWYLYSFCIYFDLFDVMNYIESKEVLIMIDGATALAITIFLFRDANAERQAVILAFAVTCHTVIIYHLTISKWWLTQPFYTYYDELIIMVGISQMLVSYNGIIRSLRNLQALLHRFSFYSYRIGKGLFKSKEGGSGA